MKTLLFFTICLGSYLPLRCQDSCRVEVKRSRYLSRLPSDLCIPSGYHISFLYDGLDVNLDGLPDLAFKWNKTELQDGDTLFVSVYLQKPDSSFLLLTTFSNLYPIFFKSYSPDYEVREQRLKEMKDIYFMGYPLKSLAFEGNQVSIKIYSDSNQEYHLNYSFGVDGWSLVSVDIYDQMDESHSRIESEKIGSDLQDFRYSDYIK